MLPLIDPRYTDARIRVAAKKLKLPVEFVATYYEVALSKMRYYGDRRIRAEIEEASSEIYKELEAEYFGTGPGISQSAGIILPTPIDGIRRLTPELIERLKREGSDFDLIDPYVFEHLVAELLAGQGFTNVRLVGRNKETSADIFAVKLVPEVGDEIRYYVEVKRHKRRIGVNVIDNVYGAMEAEKGRFGWRGSIIVTSHEFSGFEKYTRRDLLNRGIILKDKRDLFDWIDGYKPNKLGLWVPAEYCRLSELVDDNR